VASRHKTFREWTESGLSTAMPRLSRSRAVPIHGVGRASSHNCRVMSTSSPQGSSWLGQSPRARYSGRPIYQDTAGHQTRASAPERHGTRSNETAAADSRTFQPPGKSLSSPREEVRLKGPGDARPRHLRRHGSVAGDPPAALEGGSCRCAARPAPFLDRRRPVMA